MYNKGIDIRVCVNGRPTKEYTHNGFQFIESRHGTNYTVKVKNDNGYRVMVVLSVDGLDVITGKAAEESNNGYIVDAYSATEIKGYRLSDADSAAFVFTSKGKAYVTTKADPEAKRNSGVIGVRIFEEKKEKVKVIEKVVEKHIHHHHNNYPWGPNYYTYGWPTAATTVYYTGGSSLGVAGTNVTYANNVSLTGAQSYSSPEVSVKSIDKSVSNAFDVPLAANNFDSGTTWGKKQTDLVKKEYFKRGKLVVESVVYYATHEALGGMGVDLTEIPAIAHDEKPKAFGNSQYCQPPKGWQG